MGIIHIRFLFWLGDYITFNICNTFIIYYYLILAWRLYSRSHVSVVGVSSAWHTRRGHASWTLVTPPGREDAALDQVSPPSIDQPNFLPTPLPLSLRSVFLSFYLLSIYLFLYNILRLAQIFK